VDDEPSSPSSGDRHKFETLADFKGRSLDYFTTARDADLVQAPGGSAKPRKKLAAAASGRRTPREKNGCCRRRVDRRTDFVKQSRCAERCGVMKPEKQVKPIINLEETLGNDSGEAYSSKGFLRICDAIAGKRGAELAKARYGWPRFPRGAFKFPHTTTTKPTHG
jgi:hypothetical protein